ncbi:MAG: phage minor tail protein L [Rhodocyclaceae bacterium]|nr:phage minor tail protein L [Rhodocyclaceae bacterium]
MTIRADIQSLVPGALLEMFQLDIDGETYRWHGGTNDLSASVTWQGHVYTMWPVEATGFEWRGNGTLPRPTLRVANGGGLISALARAHADLVGGVVTRRRTFARYLDAVNFPGGVNPTADPNAALPTEVWFVERKSGESDVFLEFELGAACDVQGVRIPRRQVVQNVCTWRYRGADCGFTGGAVAKADDTATTDINLDACGKRLASCELRFGTTAELPFGGFPAAGLTR